jgi:hypothetical protein
MSACLNRPRLALLAAAWLCLTLTLPAHAGVPEVSDDINARIARAKIQRGGGEGGNKVKPVDASQPGGRGGDVLGDGCNIAIGNVFEQSKSGFGTSARAQTTVVVQGDVIMANNRCK